MYFGFKKRIIKSLSILTAITFILINTTYAIPNIKSLFNNTKKSNTILRILSTFDDGMVNATGKRREDPLQESIDRFQSYGISLDNITFSQISGLVDDNLGSPFKDLILKESLIAINIVALSAFYNKGCAIDPATGGKYDDAGQRKKIADGGAVTVLEKMLLSFAKKLDITIIIGGSEGKTRDGAPALEVKQVLNPGGKGIYIVHADPIENTNAQSEDKPGAWALLFLTKLPDSYEVLLRKDARLSGNDLQEFLERNAGGDLAKYKIPFCHDRYVISVSYPGNAKASKIAQFSVEDDPRIILKQIADEHNLTIEELGRKAHIVFLDRPRHEYLEKSIKKLQAEGNAITYSKVSDGDAFARVMASLGVSTYKGKKWTIVLGASGAVEGYVTGLVSTGRISADGKEIGRVRMAHATKNISGENLSGWKDYAKDDTEDFNLLGITKPSIVITENEFLGYLERIFVVSSVTGARENVDISSEFPLSGVKIEGEKIEISSFVIDKHGRGFLVKTLYKSPDTNFTSIDIRADNNYGVLDDNKKSLRDFDIKRLIGATTDKQKRVGI